MDDLMQYMHYLFYTAHCLKYLLTGTISYPSESIHRENTHPNCL